MKELIEKLAELEHEQWMDYTKYLSQNIPKGLDYEDAPIYEWIDRWKKSWVPYKDLSEKQKEKDRVYARKVMKEVYNYCIGWMAGFRAITKSSKKST
jgi:hypothetical protein